MGGGNSGSSGKPGVPTWARGAANFLFGDPNSSTGFMGDANAGQGAVDFNSLLQSIMPALQSGISGGAAQRDLASGLTNQAVGNNMGIAGMSAGSLNNQAGIDAQMPGMFGGAAGAIGQQAGLNSMVPQLFGAANDFAGNINQGEAAYNTALGGATQSLNNVMNPTLYNPLFQNAVNNQIAPTLNAQFSARGLGSGGAPIAAITRASSDLSDQFAQRQFSEQNAAQGMVANIGTGLTNSGVAAAQLPGQVFNQFTQGLSQAAQTPGQVFNQFQQGVGQGQQNYGQAAANQLAPLQALGMGSEQFWQGVNNPMNTASNVYSMSRQPMANLLTGLTGVSGGISSPHVGMVGQLLGK
jgi:hypothetical protein